MSDADAAVSSHVPFVDSDTSALASAVAVDAAIVSSAAVPPPSTAAAAAAAMADDDIPAQPKYAPPQPPLTVETSPSMTSPSSSSEPSTLERPPSIVEEPASPTTPTAAAAAAGNSPPSSPKSSSPPASPGAALTVVIPTPASPTRKSGESERKPTENDPLGASSSSSSGSPPSPKKSSVPGAGGRTRSPSEVHRPSPLGQSVIVASDVFPEAPATSPKARSRTRSADGNLRLEGRPTAAVPSAASAKRNASSKNVHVAVESEERHIRQRSRSLGAADLNKATHGDDQDSPKKSNLIGKLTKKKSERAEEHEMTPIHGTKIDEHHRNYVLMYDMLSGMRVTLSRCYAKPDRPLTAEDFTSANKLAFDITGNELTPSSKYDFKFKDYAPWVFRSLREHFKIDAVDYLVSLTGKYILSELGSPGKSGSFFYFSVDYRFIIKTISRTEHDFFLGLLPRYYDHVMKHPNTLLARYYGLHRVKLPRGPKIHFVVMGNVFPPNRDIHETYDLKGSTVGRYTEPKKDGSPAILKDQNFMELHRKLILGPEKRQIFVEQVQADSKFLASNNIMDYSLLLGIHDLSRGNKEDLRTRALSVFQPKTPNAASQNSDVTKEERKQIKKAIKHSQAVALGPENNLLPEELPEERKISVFCQDEGGFQSTDENNRPLNEIYHMGIIDILTPYDAKKRIEHAFKSLTQDGTQISAVSPSKYAERFSNFLVNGTAEYSKSEKKGKKKLERKDTDDVSVSSGSGGVGPAAAAAASPFGAGTSSAAAGPASA